MSGTSRLRWLMPSKSSQMRALKTTDRNANGSNEPAKNNGSYPAIRRRLPDERHSLLITFRSAGRKDTSP